MNIVNMKIDESNLKDAVETYEKQLIVSAISISNGNYSKAAKLLEIPKQTLQNKIKNMVSTEKLVLNSITKKIRCI